MSEFSEKGNLHFGPEIVLGSREEAEALSKEFHSTFPELDIDTVIGFSGQTGKWTVAFKGDLSNGNQAAAWLESKRPPT
ncbi:MAG: hypothetical protein HYV13_00610 [Candidatus Doudnabacteria bacterium]|nr:hypothetical protein [Candidatus Doudnabacteria bacterium]